MGGDSSVGDGGEIGFGAFTNRKFAAIKGSISDANSNGAGHLDFYTRENPNTAEMSRALRITSNGNATFSGTVNADEVSSSMMKLTNNGRIVRTDANGIGLYLEGGSGNVILPTDNKGGLKSDGPSLGNAGRKFLDAYFSGTVDAAGFTINGVPISGGGGFSGNNLVIENSGAPEDQRKWRFNVNQQNGRLRIQTLKDDDSLDISDLIRFERNGTIIATSTVTATDFIATSDERLKTSIAPMPVGLIDDIKPVSWEWIEGGGKSAGVVAQQLQEIGLGDYVHENDDGELGVNYQALTAILLAEVIALKKAVNS
jgi:hypothetical protein